MIKAILNIARGKYFFILHAHHFLFIGIAFLIGCQEPFNPEVNSEQVDIPVIEAKVTNIPAESYVKINWLAPLTSYNNIPVTGAEVNVYDDEGIRNHFEYAGNGLYLPEKSGFTGRIGKMYKLEVSLLDGNIYSSPLLEMKQPGLVNTMNASVEKEFQVTGYSSAGEPFVAEVEGVELTYNVVSPLLTRQYFLLSRILLIQQEYTIIQGINAITVYKWYIKDFIPSAEMSEFNNGVQVSKNLDGAFLVPQTDYSTRSVSSNRTVSPAYPRGWIMEVSCQVVDENTFTFYRSIEEQLSGEDQLFDPIPFQLNGNINCKTDSTKLVIGNFDVGPVSTTTYGVYWSAGNEKIMLGEIEKRNLPSSDGEVRNKPSFWFIIGMLY